ncbi:histone-binding protein N1/N2-like isoform X1 [Syngnathus typhle]|uniref:histone-binding protein N1/N2-like isoform X1 n=1 Tax=Syngnathus typhle TaxID=161592 RepID=UPI002A69B683|nr:histone-binding protein N1/N2-like isoform X1 [Syngnathus typhle]
MEEAYKLIGAGKKQLVLGKAVEAVSSLQEACGILAKAYGDTADECAEAFFWCGRALLDLARMENSVLGNALEGVPEDDEDETPQDSNVEGTEKVDEKTRDELRVQVYDAMAEKSDNAQEKETAADKKVEDKTEDSVAEEPLSDKMEEGKAVKKEDLSDEKLEKTVDKIADEKVDASDKMENGDASKMADEKVEASDKMENGETDKMADEKVEEVAEKMEEEEDSEDDAEEEQSEDNNSGEKVRRRKTFEMSMRARLNVIVWQEGDESEEEEEEVGNLQLAWEMLELAKVIYKRKESKDDQLMAAQAHLRLSEVSAESGNYVQALEDLRECLSLQRKHLDADSRLVAETYYQLGLTFSLNQQYGESVDHLNRSISVIKSRLANLTELIAKAAGPEELPEERQEMEELKALLPEIQEKVEDATDSLKCRNTESTEPAPDGASTSSASPVVAAQSGDTSPASAAGSQSQPPLYSSSTKVSSANGSAPDTRVSDISHLVRKKRKPEESPSKEGMKKKAKQDVAQDTLVVQKTNGDTSM